MTGRIRLGRRLGLLFAAVGAVFALGIVLTASTLGEIEAKGRAVVDEDALLLDRLGDLRLALGAAFESVGSERNERNRRRVAADIEVLARSRHEDEAAAYGELLRFWRAAEDGYEAHAREDAETRRDSILAVKILPALDGAGRSISRIEAARRSTSLARVRGIRDRVRDARSVLFFLVASMAVLGVVAAEVLRRRILLPIRRLEEATARIAEGDLQYRIESHGAPDDEIGDLTRRFDAMSGRLARAETARMEFLAMVSHEIRSPLMVIQGYLGLLAAGRRGPLSTPQAATVEILRSEAARMTTLVEDLLDAARAGGGGFRVDPVPTRTARDLGAALEPFAIGAEARKIGWSVDLAALPDAVVDPKRLGQAVRNLVGNALKFTPSGGRISVTGRIEGGDLALTVSDTGPGIDPAHHNDLFSLFFQADPASSAKGSVGLGLTIVRAIARAHGGEVEVASEPGKGTAFTIRIPHRVVPAGAVMA